MYGLNLKVTYRYKTNHSFRDEEETYEDREATLIQFISKGVVGTLRSDDTIAILMKEDGSLFELKMYEIKVITKQTGEQNVTR